MAKWAYDIEVYPNLFQVAFFNLESSDSPKSVSKGLGIKHKDVKVFTYSPELWINELKELLSFLSQENITLVGFNNIFYDTPVLDYVLSTNATNKEIFEFSSNLIARLNGEGGGEFFERNYKWDEIDLMKAYAFDALGVSLKQVSINLQWGRVQDLPFEYDRHLSNKEIEIVKDYNLNDVLITAELWYKSSEMMNLREELSKEYSIDFRSASDSKIANLMLNKIYEEKTKIPYEQFSVLRTKRDLVWLRNCIGKNISFKTVKLQNLLKKIMNSVVVKENEFSFKESIQFGNCNYEIGVGGLHSVDEAGIFKTDDEYIIQDADVASFYPNIILVNNIIPAHLDSRFIEILSGITKERIEAKKEGNKAKADGLKITINSIFGKLNSDTFWLQDPKSMISVTLSGQLYLLMLIESLVLNGIMVISANTDGIVCRIPRTKTDLYNNLCSEWQKKTGFELEFTEYKAYYRIDVNNYIAEKEGGKTKEKGRLVQDISLKKGYKHPIVPSAIYEYFVTGTPVMDTLKSSKNILDFCVSQKTGRDFVMEFREDGKNPDKLQKNNRFFVSIGGGSLVKVNKKTGQEIGLFVGKNVRILNDYDESISIDSYDIDFDFYLEECNKYIEEIEHSSFDFEFKEEELSNTEFDTTSLLPINENAKIVPPKFRYSGGTYRYDEAKGVIYRGIATIKYITEDAAERLYLYKDKQFDSFLDFLILNKCEIGLNSRQMEILIKINFFSEFGYNKKLLEFYTEFNKIYKPNQNEKTIAKKTQHLKDLWESLPNKSMPVKDQIAIELELLGFVQTRFKVPNSRMAFVMEADMTYSPKFKVLMLSEAKMKEIRIRKKVYNKVCKYVNGEKTEFKLAVGDFVTLFDLQKKPAVRKGKEGEEEWVEIPNLYNEWAEDYEIL